jgi:histidinol-phosphate aminotransferase
LGNGSDESIDLIIRIFCEPGVDEIIVLPPTYGMYEVSANIANVKVNKIPLNEFFQPEVSKILAIANERTKVLFICSPNNPTGALINKKDIIQLLENFNGIVVLDEAYIDFAPGATCLDLIGKHPQLILLQTLSKAWGLAGVRMGMAITSPEMISFFNKVKAPYNINILTQKFVLERLRHQQDMKMQVADIISQRERLLRELQQLDQILYVYPTDSNFILVKMKDADRAYDKLISHGVVVRNRSKEVGTSNCLRITVGTKTENDAVLKILAN